MEKCSDLAGLSTKDELDEIFIKDIKESIVNIQRNRTLCPYGNSCRRINPIHFQAESHPDAMCFEEINTFKPHTDRFLSNSFNIYCKNNGTFSNVWNSEVSAVRGDPLECLKTYEYDRTDSFSFYILANITLNHIEYAFKYGSGFMVALHMALESNDNTGLFQVTNDKFPLIYNILKPLPAFKKTNYVLMGNSSLKELFQVIEEKKRKGPSTYKSSRVVLNPLIGKSKHSQTGGKKTRQNKSKKTGPKKTHKKRQIKHKKRHNKSKKLI